MTCENITTKIRQLASSKADFDLSFGQKNTKESFATKEKIDNFLLETLAQLGPEYIFNYILEKPQTIKRIQAIRTEIQDKGHGRALNDNDYIIAYTKLAELLDVPSSSISLTSEHYDRFLQLLQSHNDIDKKTLTYINSVFLNKFAEKETIYHPEKLKEPIDSFGIFLKEGRYILDKLGSQAGVYLDGAVIHVRETENLAGYKMRSGKLFVWDLASDRPGYNQSGGLLYVNDINLKFTIIGSGMSGGLLYLRHEFRGTIDEMAGGNIILEQKSGLELTMQTSKRVWHPEKGERGMVYINAVDEQITCFSDPLMLHFINTMLDADMAVALTHDYDYSVNNPTQDMKKGILVLYSLPPVIGDGMTDGAVIVEAPTSIGEVKKLISPNKKGGAILLRIADPKDKEKSFLVDVEEAEYYLSHLA